MNKKAEVIPMITGVPAMVLLALIIFLFGILFLFLSKDINTEITNISFNSREDLRLINYLKTPIEINNEKTTIGELIISSNEDKTKRTTLEEEINKLPLTLNAESIKQIDVLQIEFIDDFIIGSREIEDSNIEAAAIFLPTQNPKESIIVTLYNKNV